MATKLNGRGNVSRCLRLAYNATPQPTVANWTIPMKQTFEIVLLHSVSNLSYSLASTAAKLVFKRMFKKCLNYIFMTQLAADFAVKGLLNLMTSSTVATGLVH